LGFGIGVLEAKLTVLVIADAFPKKLDENIIANGKIYKKFLRNNFDSLIMI
jgi:hypothetical protein|tara:strand:+ start:495 stop:647 length:153 start_codon:yes stop_codon:yes gene_type:complete